MPRLSLYTEGVYRLMSLLTPSYYHNQYKANWHKSTHWRKASCEEVACPQYLNGWVTKLDPRLHAQQEYYIQHDKERRHRMEVVDGLHHYYFEAGQRCFGGDHYKKLERSPLLSKNGTVLEAERWVDDFNEQVDRNNTRR
jgi:hypothetical protein